MFGEPSGENQDGFSESMKAKLAAFKMAGGIAAKAIKAQSVLDALGE